MDLDARGLGPGDSGDERPVCSTCSTAHGDDETCDHGAGVLPEDRHAQRERAAALFAPKTPHEPPTLEERAKLQAKQWTFWGIDPVRAVLEEAETRMNDPAASEAVREEALSVRESAQRAEHDRTDTVRLCEGLERVREMQRRHEHDLHLQKDAAPPPATRQVSRPGARRTPTRDGRTARPAGRRTSRVTRAGPSSSDSDDPPQPEPHRPAATLVVTRAAGVIIVARSKRDAIIASRAIAAAIRQNGERHRG
jgi:hypothetical protein